MIISLPSSLISLATTAQHMLQLVMPNMPPEAWWVGALILFTLGLAATIDAYTSTVPDPLIFTGLLALTGLQGYYVSWPFAAAHLTAALAAMFIIWTVNELWFRFFKQDALGMGDAKWTMLAVAGFGTMPALVAWGAGACLGVFWMGVMALLGYRTTRLYFAPFLFIGLLAGLYVLRLRPAGF